MKNTDNSRELLILDQSALLRAAEQRCMQEQERLDAYRLQLDEFEKIDQPAFVAWIHEAFKEELDELKKKRETYNERIETLRKVEREAVSKNTSFEKAYERVLEREPVQKEFEFDEDAFHAEVHEEPFNRPDRELPSEPAPEPAHESLKNYYRELVRRLHPDLNPNLSEAERNLWHQVQDAYKNRNFERLKQLATQTGFKDEESAPRFTLSDLREMFQELRRACNALKKEIRKTQGEHGWRFRETLKDPLRLRRLTMKVSVDLDADLQDAESGIQEIEQVFEGWQRERDLQRKEKSLPRRTRGRGRRSKR